MRSTGAPIGVVGNPIPVAAGTIASVTTASPAPARAVMRAAILTACPKKSPPRPMAGPWWLPARIGRNPSAAATRSARTVIVAIIWLGVAAASMTASPIVFTTCTPGPTAAWARSASRAANHAASRSPQASVSTL